MLWLIRMEYGYDWVFYFDLPEKVIDRFMSVVCDRDYRAVSLIRTNGFGLTGLSRCRSTQLPGELICRALFSIDL